MDGFARFPAAFPAAALLRARPRAVVHYLRRLLAFGLALSLAQLAAIGPAAPVLARALALAAATGSGGGGVSPVVLSAQAWLLASLAPTLGGSRPLRSASS